MATDETPSSEMGHVMEQLKVLQREFKETRLELSNTNQRLEKVEKELDLSSKRNKHLEEIVTQLQEQIHTSKSEDSNTKTTGNTVEHSKNIESESPSDDSIAQPGLDLLDPITEKEEGEINDLSVAEALKETAEQAMQQSGFVYDEQTGLYYDYASGYYYDSENSLYYDPNTGTYYYYDCDKQEYLFHSQIDLAEHQANYEAMCASRKKKKKRNNEKVPQKQKHTKENTNSKTQPKAKKLSSVKTSITQPKVSVKKCLDMFLPSEDESSNDKLDEEENKSSDTEDGEVSSSDSESGTGPNSPMPHQTALSLPPCIRAMVITSDTLDVGSLFVIPYTGSTIGREQNVGHAIHIPDLNVSKMHAEIYYSEEEKRYFIKDYASQNGTFINEKRLNEAKVMGEGHLLKHRDKLQVGGTCLDIHIHLGTDTCDACEPGQVLANLKKEAKNEPVISKAEKERRRRENLKRIKKKYGLGNSAYVSGVKKSAYQDKAAERRKTVGSDSPFEKRAAPASVHVPIAAENKGRKLLAKMGWSEGDGLGKSQSGIAEPIKINIRTKQKAGLGSQSATACSLDDVALVKSSEKWIKAQERFMAVQKAGDGSSPSKVQNAKNITFVKGSTRIVNEQEISLDDQPGE